MLDSKHQADAQQREEKKSVRSKKQWREGGHEAGGDPRPGGKKRAIEGRPGVKGDVTLRRVHRSE